jgi:glutathione peroxidase
VAQQQAAEQNYGVTFPVFGLVNVNPPDEHPVFTWLKATPEGAGAVQWNFTKWLVSREGEVLGRWSTATSPDDIRSDIEAAL